LNAERRGGPTESAFAQHDGSHDTAVPLETWDRLRIQPEELMLLRASITHLPSRNLPWPSSCRSRDRVSWPQP
jgi:hypothetical protein